MEHINLHIIIIYYITYYFMSTLTYILSHSLLSIDMEHINLHIIIIYYITYYFMSTLTYILSHSPL